MTACVLALGIITCSIAPGSRLDPAAAAAIVAPHQFVAPGQWNDGPTVTVIASSPTAGPFGEFAPFSEARRLDGSVVSEPPWGTVSGYGYGYGGRGYLRRPFYAGSIRPSVGGRLLNPTAPTFSQSIPRSLGPSGASAAGHARPGAGHVTQQPARSRPLDRR